MRRHAVTILIGLLLLTGLGVLLYPTVSNWLAERNQSTAIQDYTLTAAQLTELEREELLEEARAYNRMLTGADIQDPFIPESGFVVPEEYRSILNVNGVMGYLDIPAIDVSLPIYHGTGEEALADGVGHMEATAFPVGGAGNHTVLTGHSALPSARLFTDLDKLVLGDVFYITVLGETLCYTVDEITVVEPTETAALLPVPGEDYVTLITCTPYGINSHRLFVRGVRTDYTPETEGTAVQEDEAAGLTTPLLIAGGGLITAGVTGLVVRRRRRRAG